MQGIFSSTLINLFWQFFAKNSSFFSLKNVPILMADFVSKIWQKIYCDIGPILVRYYLKLNQHVAFSIAATVQWLPRSDSYVDIIYIKTKNTISIKIRDSLREALTKKKMFSFGHCPKRGGGDPCPNFLTLFFHHVVPYILTSISCYVILFGHF